MHVAPALARLALIASVIVLGGVSTARASFVSTSPDRFPPGSGFVQAAGCIASGPLAPLCVDNVTALILSSGASFVGGDELAVLDERVTGDVTDNGVLLGSFSVLGTLSLTVFDRGSPDEPGTFSATVTSDNYLGMIDGIPLQVTLDPSDTSTATITVTLIQSRYPQLYRINTSFDLFSQISIAGEPPIPVGGFPITGVAIPEPGTILLMGLPLVTLARLRKRAPRDRLISRRTFDVTPT
jgi:hypothetical protein